jgi:hypothetical protein
LNKDYQQEIISRLSFSQAGFHLSALPDGSEINGLRIHHHPHQIPVADHRLDMVTCSTAHLYPTTETFIRELGRCLKHEGGLGILSPITSEVPRLARYCNLFYRLHKPTHQWAYSLHDWHFFLEMAGLEILSEEVIGTSVYLGEWADNCDEITLERLRVMLLQAPQPVRDWYQIEAKPGLSPYKDIRFTIPQVVIIAQNAP